MMKRAWGAISRGSALILWVLAALIVACGAQPLHEATRTAPRPPQISPPEDWLPIITAAPKKPGDLRDLLNCAQAPFTPPHRGPWESIDNKNLAKNATPNHRGSDAITYVGHPAQVTASAQYDQEPLKHEWVRLFIHTCAKWTQLGLTKTDEQGQVFFSTPKELPPGVYSLVFQIVGDASTIRTELWVISPQTKVIAMELDGAVVETTSFDSIDKDSLLSERDPIRGATELAASFAQRGHLVAYLTRRAEPFEQEAPLRERLRKQGFPVGPLVNVSSLASQLDHSPVALNTVFAADPNLPQELKNLGIPIEELVLRADVCQPLDDGQRSGWSDHLAAQQRSQD